MTFKGKCLECNTYFKTEKGLEKHDCMDDGIIDFDEGDIDSDREMQRERNFDRVQQSIETGGTDY
jgi:hypothetical protein